MACDIPDDAVNGNYVMYISATDLNGNWFQVGLPFIVGGGSSDSAPPAISEIDAPTTVSRSETFEITYRVTDESGVATHPGSIPFALVRLVRAGYEFGDEDDIRGWFTVTGAPVLDSGDALDGVYHQGFRGNGNTRPGVYEVWLIALDTVGNFAFTRTATTLTVTR